MPLSLKEACFQLLPLCLIAIESGFPALAEGVAPTHRTPVQWFVCENLTTGCSLNGGACERAQEKAAAILEAHASHRCGEVNHLGKKVPALGEVSFSECQERRHILRDTSGFGVSVSYQCLFLRR